MSGHPINDQAICVLAVLHGRSGKYSIRARVTFLRKVTERRDAGEGMRLLRDGRDGGVI